MVRGWSFLLGAVAGVAAGWALRPYLDRSGAAGPPAGRDAEPAAAGGGSLCPECGAPDATPLDGGVLYRHVGGDEEAGSRTVYWVLLQCRECRAEWHEETVEREELAPA